LTKKKTTRKKKVKKTEKEQESSDDGDDPNAAQMIAKKKERPDDEEPSGCCQFCFWNCREGHRCLSFFSYYNYNLSRPVRWTILVMSWYLFMAFTGLFMGGNNVSSFIHCKLHRLLLRKTPRQSSL
jgi:hypothetical protein